MKATYKMTLEIEIRHDVDSILDVKSGCEMAESVGQMICDEVVMCDGVACFDILESSLNVE